MQTLTRTAALEGPNPIIIDVECCTTSGFAGLQLIGNTSELLRDGKERAKTALEKLGFKLGHKRILINLAPADLRKEGNHFDLPIALSLACLCSEKPPMHVPADYLFAAELSLDGQLRPIRAAVPLALAAIKNGLKGIVLAAANAPEIEAMRRLFVEAQTSVQYLFFDQLQDVLGWLYDDQSPRKNRADIPLEPGQRNDQDFDDMHLQPELKQLAVTCAAGRHSLLLRGSPGAGKSMFMTRLPSILPAMNQQEHFQALQTYSMHQSFVPTSILQGRPPFRHPHHSSSPQALLGTAIEPGDLSLAHGGVLFLDELPEFRRDLLEALREPLENGLVNISRAQKKCQWPARVQFVAACNNCPCGWYGSTRHECRCPSNRLMAYWSRISGPILDRIDIHFNVPEPDQPAIQLFASPENAPKGQTQKLREAVQRCVEFAGPRHAELGVKSNSEISADQMPRASGCAAREFESLVDIFIPLRLSNRAILRSLRVARTLADSDSSEAIRIPHVRQAVSWQAVMAAKERGERSV
ncbi:MAG TPA: YifB family Mg chelatase-like AAA ATPase [Oligoflexus sp.]|uniref:YifB family Mg chelatase-like AAA ATPase n=1 Tax=Oligoflexus sp. TaxID=1971216 RepID=UPI002D63FDAC|nr:YifB family Mg chelatase-like AAA ATPase [Oligoflexus sp.]HYX32480.1 YifB family Mg chelatase-like AAA ATPase [Oligoflexus sp.]